MTRHATREPLFSGALTRRRSLDQIDVAINGRQEPVATATGTLRSLGASGHSVAIYIF
jgi:hypothetical protein